MRDDSDKRLHTRLHVPVRKPSWTYYDYDLQAVAWLPDDSETIAIAGGSGRVFLLSTTGAILWESSSITSRRPGALERSGVLHSFIERIAISPDGALIAATTFDHQVAVWRHTDSTRALWRWSPKGERNANKPLGGITFSPDGAWLITGDHVGRLRGWYTATLTESKRPDWIAAQTGSPAVDLMWPEGSPQLTVAHANGVLRRWEPRRRKPALELDAKLTTVAATPGPDIGQVTLASPDGVFIASWRDASTHRILTQSTQSVAWTRGDVLAAKHSNTITLHRSERDGRLESIAQLSTARGLRGQLSFSPDGALLAGALATQIGACWNTRDLAHGEPLREPPPPRLHPRFAEALPTLSVSLSNAWHIHDEPWRGFGPPLWSQSLDAPITRRFAVSDTVLHTSLERDGSGVSFHTQDLLRREPLQNVEGLRLTSSGPGTLLNIPGSDGVLAAPSCSVTRFEHGRVLWHNPLMSRPPNSQDVPCITPHGLVVVGYPLDRVLVFDLESGEQVGFWSGSIHKSDPFAIDAEHLLLGLATDRIGAISLRTRRLAWSHELSRPNAIAARDGQVFFVCPYDFKSFSSTTGEQLWSYRFEKYSTTPRLILTDTTLLLHRNTTLRGLDPVSGDVLWSRPTLSTEDNPGYALCDGRLLLPDGPQLRVILPESGDEEASFTLPADISAPPTVRDGVLYIATADAQLHAFAPAQLPDPDAETPDERRRAALLLGMQEKRLEAPEALLRLRSDANPEVARAAMRAVEARILRGTEDASTLLEAVSESALERLTTPEAQPETTSPDTTQPSITQAPAPLPPPRELPGLASGSWREAPRLLWNTFCGVSRELLLAPDLESLFLVNDSPEIRSIDLTTGVERWRTRLPQSRNSSRFRLSRHGADHLLVSWHNDLCRVNAHSGHIVWARCVPHDFHYEGTLLANPVEGGVIATVSTGKVSVIDFWSESGEPLGRLEMEARVQGLRATHGLWVGYSGLGVCGFERGTGRVVWQHEARMTQSLGPPLLFGGTVILATERAVHAFDVRTGEVVWNNAPGAMRLDAPPIVEGGTVFIPGYNYGRGHNHLFAIDATTGETLWSSRIAGSSVAPVAADSVLLQATDKNSLLALDRADGTQLWRRDFPYNVHATPRVHDGICYVLCHDQQLYALMDSERIEM